MVAEASITGILKTVLIIGGAFLFLRFLGRLIVAKRNMEEERVLNAQQRNVENERREKMRNFGQTTVLGKKSESKNKSSSQSNTVDIDFEEID